MFKYNYLISISLAHIFNLIKYDSPLYAQFFLLNFILQKFQLNSTESIKNDEYIIEKHLFEAAFNTVT